MKGVAGCMWVWPDVMRVWQDVICYVCLQPVADRPFTFETELDDLPKEKLKRKIHFVLLCISVHLVCACLACFRYDL